jgi:hypothetical protein
MRNWGRVSKLVVVLLAVSLFLQPTIASGQEDLAKSPDAAPEPYGLSPLIDRRSIIGARLFAEVLSPPSPSRVTLAFTGDTLIHNTVTAAARRGDGLDFRPMFASVRHLIGGADLAICHLEVPLSPSSSHLSSYPRFNGPAEVAEALAWAGYDGCSTASNHSYDKGVDGVLGTLQVLDRAGVSQAGMADRISNWWQPTYYQVGDLTVGHVSATYWLNGLRMPADREWLVQLLDVEEVLAIASRARAGGADLVVVSMHCCTEYRKSPTTSQVEMSHRLIESPNVDLVVTHHSHMVGPVERVGDEFILHGLGNFLSGQIQSSSLQDGVIAFAHAVESEGRWRFESIDFAPTQVVRGSYRIEPAEGASYDRTMAALAELGENISVFRSPSLSREQLQLIE